MNNLVNKKILVLGGAGFLGQNILKKLSEQSFSNLYCGDLNSINIEGVKNIKIDVLDSKDLTKKIKSFPLIINCIGQVTNPINLCFQLNTKGISNITMAV